MWLFKQLKNSRIFFTNTRLFLFGCIGVCVVGLAVFVTYQRMYTPTRAIEEHLQSIQSGMYEEAYADFSKSTKKTMSFTDFRSELLKTPVLLYISDYTIFETKQEGRHRIVDGEFVGKPGTLPVSGTYVLERQGISWKIIQYTIAQQFGPSEQMAIRLDDLGVNVTAENTITNKRTFLLSDRSPISVIGELQHLPKGTVLTAVLTHMDTVEVIATKKVVLSEDIVAGDISFTFPEGASLSVGTHAVIVNLFPSESTHMAIDQQMIRFRVIE
jgi:hypothetical protein